MASAKSSNKTESFKDLVIRTGYLGFAQGDRQNEWYPLTDQQYDFIGKMKNISSPFSGAREGLPEEYKGKMANPHNTTTIYEYTVTPLNSTGYFDMRLLLTNNNTKMKRIVVFTQDLFPHGGATTQKGGSRIKCKTTHKKKKIL